MRVSMGEPGVDPLLEVCVFMLLWVQLTRATSHNMAVARYGVSHVEVVNGVGEESTADLSVSTFNKSDSMESSSLNSIISHKVRGKLSKTSSDLVERVVRKWSAKFFREGSEDHPVFTGKTWRRNGRPGLLDSAIHVDISTILFKIACSR